MRRLFLPLLLLLSARTSLARSPSSSCDPLVPEHCLLPFPNDFYLAADNATSSGRRIRLPPDALPLSNDNVPIDPSDWLHLDGFARMLPLTTLAVGVDLDMSRLPRQWDIAQSLLADNPTSLLIDAETGDAVAHWCELDVSSPEARDEESMLLMWPAAPLAFGKRYIVAYRWLRNADGDEIESSDYFNFLCNDTFPANYDDDEYDKYGDGNGGKYGKYGDNNRKYGKNNNEYDKNNDKNNKYGAFHSFSLADELRRDHFATSILSLLSPHGFSCSDLFITWDFTIQSAPSAHTWLTHMATDARSRLPPTGPAYRIDAVLDDPGEFTARHVVGSVRVPFYLEAQSPGSKLARSSGQDGLPTWQGDAWVTFSLTVPVSVALGHVDPSGVVMYGHGLFQNHWAILADDLQAAGDVGGLVLFGTDMTGMSSSDAAAIAKMLATDVSDAAIIPHGCMQGVVNALVLQQLVLSDAFADDPVLQFNNGSVLNRNVRGYFGYSLGGVYGPTILALSDTFHVGVFGVPGAPFVHLLPRASPFKTYWDIIEGRYDDPRDRTALLSLMQLIWDHVDSISYVDMMASDARKMSQFVWAKGDTQVTHLGCNALARGAGARAFVDYVTGRDNETLFGFDIVPDEILEDGHVVVGYDFGVPELPIYNVMPDAKDDTHNLVYKQDTFVHRALSLFLEKRHLHGCEGRCGYDDEWARRCAENKHGR